MSFIRMIDGFVPIVFLICSLALMLIAIYNDHLLGGIASLAWLFCFLWTAIREAPVPDDSSHKYDWELLDEERKQ